MRKITSIKVVQKQSAILFRVRHSNGEHDDRYSSDMSNLEWDAMQKLLRTMNPEIEMGGEELIVFYYPR